MNILEIRKALEELRMKHNICIDDSHYSCPASGECTDSYYKNNALFQKGCCTCGVGEHNKKLDLIIKSIK